MILLKRRTIPRNAEISTSPAKRARNGKPPGHAHAGRAAIGQWKYRTGSWPSLRRSLQPPSSLRPLLFSMGKSAYCPSSERGANRSHAFRSPVRPIHPYAAVGPRFSPARLRRAHDPPRRFPYTTGTPPQPAGVFIRGFVSPPWNHERTFWP